MKRLFLYVMCALPGVILCLLALHTGIPFFAFVLIVEATVMALRRMICRREKNVGKYENVQLLMSTAGLFVGAYLNHRVNPPTAEFNAPVIVVVVWLFYAIFWLLLEKLVQGVFDRNQ